MRKLTLKLNFKSAFCFLLDEYYTVFFFLYKAFRTHHTSVEIEPYVSKYVMLRPVDSISLWFSSIFRALKHTSLTNKKTNYFTNRLDFELLFINLEKRTVEWWKIIHLNVWTKYELRKHYALVVFENFKVLLGFFCQIANFSTKYMKISEIEKKCNDALSMMPFEKYKVFITNSLDEPLWWLIAFTWNKNKTVEIFFSCKNSI